MTIREQIEEHDVEIHGDFAPFFDGGFERVQGRPLVGLEYLSPLYVDFAGTFSEAWERTLADADEQGFCADARESISLAGVELVPIAWLFADRDADEPEGAYLVCDVTQPGGAVYLADPSGSPELVAPSFEQFVARLLTP